jgi:hypothetical protein
MKFTSTIPAAHLSPGKPNNSPTAAKKNSHARPGLGRGGDGSFANGFGLAKLDWRSGGTISMATADLLLQCRRSTQQPAAADRE